MIRNVSVQEAESLHSFQDDRLGSEPIPFGFQNSQWLEFIDQMEEGDELWLFKSDAKTWKRKVGREGIALIRGNTIVKKLVTRMN